MDYDEYKVLFEEKALKKEKSHAYITVCLAYAKRIMDNGSQLIYDSKHLSLLVGVDENYIMRAVTYSKKYYWIFKIPKHNGGTRTISEPLPTLKNIQLWILHNVLEKKSVHPFAKAYIPHKKLKENAKFHTKQEVVISMDITDFFTSIKMESIALIFNNIGYSKKLSYLLAKLCCLKGCLPQGSPTSPYLSNLYMFSFDETIKEFCRSKKIIYTRYADDLTFSSKEKINIKVLKNKVAKELYKLKLNLNDKKTKIMYRSDAQIVTGIEVNQRMRLPKKERNSLRQEMYYVITKGVEDHLNHIGCKKSNYEKHLLGKITYALYLEPSNPEFIDYRYYLMDLLKPDFVTIQRIRAIIRS